MNNKELLELAAKACGLLMDGIFYGNHNWNPLEDDGDALRLAVKLKLNIEHMETMSRQDFGINVWPVGGGQFGASEDELYINDRLTATRRAIVRAAAEIGKTL